MTDGRRHGEPPRSATEPAKPGPAGAADEKRFAIVLGATSIVGRYLVRRLADRGFDGWCLSRRPVPDPYEPPPGFRWRDLAGDAVSSAPARSAWFSLIPIPALPALMNRVREGDRLVALSTSSARFKAASSDPEERRLMERVRGAEEEIQQTCRDRGVPWTIFRPTLVYDPGRDRNVTMIAKVVRRLGVFPIVWPGLGGRQPIHADDVALAMTAALEAPGAWNRRMDLPGGETLAYREMVRAVFRSLGKRPILVYLPLGPARLAFRAWRALTGTDYSVASLERMNESLTLDGAPVREALGITLRPFRPEFPGPAGSGGAPAGPSDGNGG